MDDLFQLVGRERSLHEVARTVRGQVQELHAPVAGAFLVTCSDESEAECAEAFQRNLVTDLLPSLKFAYKSAFRTATLGAWYEWGAVRVAEEHYATAESAQAFKVMVVKLNSHVSVESGAGGHRFGRMQRYQGESSYCGLLHALLDDLQGLPAVERVREAFLSEGKDRLGMLRDPGCVEPGLRPLFAAVANARLQTRRIMLDVQDHQPHTPTVFLILPCVTFNRERADSELLCGAYTADFRGPDPVFHYAGLGDDPSRYRLGSVAGRLEIRDTEDEQPRTARDHRVLVALAWQAAGGPAPPSDERIHQLATRARREPHAGPHVKAILEGLLVALGEVAPIPAAVLLFASGMAGIYHVFRAHRLAGSDPRRADAEHIMRDVQQNLDRMSDEDAHRALEVLLQHFAPTGG